MSKSLGRPDVRRESQVSAEPTEQTLTVEVPEWAGVEGVVRWNGFRETARTHTRSRRPVGRTHRRTRGTDRELDPLLCTRSRQPLSFLGRTARTDPVHRVRRHLHGPRRELYSNQETRRRSRSTSSPPASSPSNGPNTGPRSPAWSSSSKDDSGTEEWKVLEEFRHEMHGANRPRPPAANVACRRVPLSLPLDDEQSARTRRRRMAPESAIRHATPRGGYGIEHLGSALSVADSAGTPLAGSPSAR